MYFLGVHCEGPFINAEKKGAHEECYIIDRLSPSLVRECYGNALGNVKIITLAPELSGSNETIKWLTEELGWVVSLGHSMSSLSTAETAFGCGASLITHLFNAMLPVREGGREGGRLVPICGGGGKEGGGGEGDGDWCHVAGGGGIRVWCLQCHVAGEGGGREGRGDGDWCYIAGEGGIRVWYLQCHVAGEGGGGREGGEEGWRLVLCCGGGGH